MCTLSCITSVGHSGSGQNVEILFMLWRRICYAILSIFRRKGRNIARPGVVLILIPEISFLGPAQFKSHSFIFKIM